MQFLSSRKYELRPPNGTRTWLTHFFMLYIFMLMYPWELPLDLADHNITAICSCWPWCNQVRSNKCDTWLRFNFHATYQIYSWSKQLFFTDLWHTAVCDDYHLHQRDVSKQWPLCGNTWQTSQDKELRLWNKWNLECVNSTVLSKRAHQDNLWK